MTLNLSKLLVLTLTLDPNAGNHVQPVGAIWQTQLQMFTAVEMLATSSTLWITTAPRIGDNVKTPPQGLDRFMGIDSTPGRY